MIQGSVKGLSRCNRTVELFERTISRPKKHVGAAPLKHEGKPSEQVHQVATLANHGHRIRERECVLVVASRVVLENAFELGLMELAASIIRLRIRAVLASVDVGDIDAQEGIGKPSCELSVTLRKRRIRKGSVDDGNG